MTAQATETEQVAVHVTVSGVGVGGPARCTYRSKLFSGPDLLIKSGLLAFISSAQRMSTVQPLDTKTLCM